MRTPKSVEPFVPLPDPWPEVPVCILGMFGSCEDCCTRATDGDLCAKCDREYERIANFLRPYILETVRECARALCLYCDQAPEPLRVEGHYYHPGIGGCAASILYRRFPDALGVPVKQEKEK